jgi:hypothetical protein
VSQRIAKLHTKTPSILRPIPCSAVLPFSVVDWEWVARVHDFTFFLRSAHGAFTYHPFMNQRNGRKMLIWIFISDWLIQTRRILLPTDMKKFGSERCGTQRSRCRKIEFGGSEINGDEGVSKLCRSCDCTALIIVFRVLAWLGNINHHESTR